MDMYGGSVYALDMSTLRLSEIRVGQAWGSNVLGQHGPVTETTSVSLAKKMEEYIFDPGCSSAHTLGVVVQLLTVGKIRLDFPEYSERLQLENVRDLLPSAEAMQSTGALLSKPRVVFPYSGEPLDATQNGIIQASNRLVI